MNEHSIDLLIENENPIMYMTYCNNLTIARCFYWTVYINFMNNLAKFNCALFFSRGGEQFVFVCTFLKYRPLPE